MKTRSFGSGGPEVSEVGLGTWQIGAEWGDVPEDRALEILATAAESGVTFFDTADVYGRGRSESLIGRYLRESRRDDIFVATKLGRFPEPGWPENFTRAAIRAHAEASLGRLGVEALDLTQLHCIPEDVMRRGDVFEHLRELRAEGKIRRFGASVESMDEALLCLEQDGLASLQIIFNIFRQKPRDVLFERAKAKGVAIIVRLPLASGLLSGKLTKSSTFAENDHRTFNRDGDAFNVGETFAGLPFELGVDLAEEMRGLLPTDGTMAQEAIRWCLDHDAVAVVIPGATKVEQARQNSSASELPRLSTELHRGLRELYEAKVRPHIRGPY